MTSLVRRRSRPLLALASATCVAAGPMGALGAGAAVRPASAGSGAAGAVQIRGAAGGASATLAAPYLASLGMSATGSLVTGKTSQTSYNCAHDGDSLSASWTQATALAKTFGWKFVSATATYPSHLSQLSPAKARAQTCGSAATLDQHGLPGAHGLIAYPGAQTPPASIQATDGARCFAWGRVYASTGTTPAAAGITPPFWQSTRALNGGACNDPSALCYTIPSHGSKHYQEPSEFIALVNALRPGQWLTLQAFVLVIGKNPPYMHNGTRWNCTSANPDRHWTNDNERYCYNDWQQIVKAIKARGNIIVTDPLTVGKAFGRPSTYP